MRRFYVLSEENKLLARVDQQIDFNKYLDLKNYLK